MGKASKKSSKVDPSPAVAPLAKSLTKGKREAEEAITKPNVKKQKVDKKLEQVLLNEKSKVKSPKKKEATQKDNTARAADPKQNKALIKKNTVVSKKVKPSSSSGSSSSSQSDSDEDSIPKPVVASKPLHAGSKNGPVSISGNGGKPNESSDSSSSSGSDSEEETPVKGPASKKLTSISKKDAVSSDTDSSSSSGSDSNEKVSKSKKATPLSSKKATPLSSTVSKSQLAVPLKKAESSDSSESESDSDDDIATVPPSKPSKKAEAAIRSGSSSSSESDSDEDVAVKAAVSRPSKAVMNNGTVGSEKTEPTGSSDSSSSSESDSDEDAIAKPAVSTKPSHAAGAKIGTVSSAKKVKPSSSSDSSSSSESDSEGEPPVKAVPASNRQSTLSKKVVSAVKVAESTDSSSSSESDSDEEEKLPKKSPGTVIKSKPSLPKTKQESSDETDTDSSDDDAYKPALDKSTVPAAKHQQSSDEDSDNSDSDSSEGSDEAPQRKKPKQNSDAKMLDAVTPKIDSKPIQSKSGKKDLTTSITPQSQSAGSKTLFAGNLNFDTEKGDLENFFKSAGEILDIRPASHPDGSFRGFAHVEYATVEAAQKAAEALDGKTLLGRSVHLNFARERGERGSSTPYSSQREGDQKPTVFVRGFDRSLGEDEIKDALKEHFGGCGVISRISIPLYQDSGAIKGIAYIDVGDASQLNKALELNGSELGGYPLVVEEAMPRGGGGDSYGRGRGGRSGRSGRSGGGRSSGREDFGHRSGGRDGGGRFGGRDGGGRFGGRRGFGGRGGGGRGNLNKQSAGTPSAGKKTTFGD